MPINTTTSIRGRASGYWSKIKFLFKSPTVNSPIKSLGSKVTQKLQEIFPPIPGGLSLATPDNIYLPCFVSMVVKDASGGSSSVLPPKDERILITKEKLLGEIRAFSNSYPFFTKEEITWHLEETYRVPLKKVSSFLNEFVNESVLQTGEILNSTFYYLRSVDPDKKTKDLELTKFRIKNSFLEFTTEINKKIEKLERCDSKEMLENILREGREKLGFRGIYLFAKVDGLIQVIFTSDRELSYKEEETPEGVMKTVLDGVQTLYRIEIGENLGDAKQAFNATGFLEVDKNWIQDSLLNNHIGSIDLLKLTDKEGEPKGVLLLRDPVYFGEGNQGETDRRLIKFAQAIGQAMGKLGEIERLAKKELLGVGGKTSIEDKEIFSQPKKVGNKFFEKKRVIPYVFHDEKGLISRYQIEVIPRPEENLYHIKEQTIKTLDEITREAWGEFGQNFIENHFFNVDKLLIVREEDTNEIVAFQALKKLQIGKIEIYFLEAAMVRPRARRKRITTNLTYMLLKEALIENKGRAILTGARTMNPINVHALSRLANPFPNYEKKKEATPQEREIGKFLVNYTSPDKEFDENNFVIKGAYKDYPDLMFKLNGKGEPIIPESVRNLPCFPFCEKWLGYKDQKGNGFIITGKFTIVVAIKSLFKNLGISLKNRIIRKALEIFS